MFSKKKRKKKDFTAQNSKNCNEAQVLGKLDL